MPFNIGKQDLGNMDELDINSFSMKPDALIYFTIAQIVGILAQNVDKGKPLIEGLMIKCMMVDDLEDLCEAQGYINPDAKNPVTGEKVEDPYYRMVKEETISLGLDKKIENESIFWQKSSLLARKRMKFLERRVFNSASKFKELQY